MSGSQMHNDDAQARSEAARALGSAKSPAKAAAARANAAGRIGKPLSEEHRRKISEKNAAYWEKKRQEKAEAASTAIEAQSPKRPRGRPVGWRKNTTAETPANASTSETGADQG